MLSLAFLLLAASPSPQELVQKAITLRDEQSKLEWKYTYREEVERKQIDKSGQATTDSVETYDVIMLEGENYRKLVLINGQPLDAKRQKQADEALEKARTQRRQRSSLTTIRRTVRIGDLGALTRLFDLRLAGEESLDGRQTWRVEAEPKAGYAAASKEEQEFLATRRTIWFDQQTGLDLQRKHHFLKPINGFQPGSEILMVYLPSGLIHRLTLIFDLKARAVLRARGETHHRFSNYQRFQTESKLLP